MSKHKSVYSHFIPFNGLEAKKKLAIMINELKIYGGTMNKSILTMLIILPLVVSGCYGTSYQSLKQHPVIYTISDLSYQLSSPRSTVYIVSSSPYRPSRLHRTIYVYSGSAYRSLEPRRAINAHSDVYRQSVESHPIINAHSIDLHRLIEHTSIRYGIPPAFAAAIAQIESNYDSCAVSHMNAQGIMQLIPNTAAELNVSDPYDPVQGIQGGIAYLAKAYRLTRGDLSLSAAYYNAGPKALEMMPQRWPRETQNYIRKLVRMWPKFQGDNWRRQVPKTIRRTNRQYCSYIVSK